jgi:type I restriction enzyme R subunit
MDSYRVFKNNRILNEQKSTGNIVVFRNLKAATIKAITYLATKKQ